MQQPPQKAQLRLEIPANMQTLYANVVIVSHTHSEMILDFVQVMPNDPRARVVSRIAMTPANAKLFLGALGQNIGNFETKHGEISTPPKPVTLADQLFNNIKSDEPDTE